MCNHIHHEATTYLNQLRRVASVAEGRTFQEDVLLLPQEAHLIVDCSCNATVSAISNLQDKKAKDILRVIEVQNAFQVSYTETNILCPSIYAHSLEDKPWHITTQAFLVSYISPATRIWIEQETKRLGSYYGKHPMDNFWLPCSKPLENLEQSDAVCIFNRRISGWDGSLERPVIELLGAGGHLQAIWNGSTFQSRSLTDNLRKEFTEEIGITLKDEDLQCIGGFANTKTHELVVFFCVFLHESILPVIQQNALGNYGEDTDGIYLCTFREAIATYSIDPEFFAGGKKAAPTNFPNNKQIMDSIEQLLANHKA